ncbi:hypothetical protein GBAR_LOCUS5015 [Geodia barretti]|uniref:Uncharacterized protein n=1 Tax=Geodia barretti TaxID=519541 RepID=A0AA35RBA9_GEOBA|nr:hypothetical protein GBAR_LOCUS5015 [Geodia barretti]
MPGYKGVVTVGKPKKELHCSQCSLLLRRAMQTGEGDRICHSCWQEKKRGGVWLECYPDRAADREVQLLEVFCPREANGCLWQGKLADLEEHFQECGEKPNPEFQTCPNEGCGELVPSSEIKYHSKWCPCKHCRRKMLANQSQVGIRKRKSEASSDEVHVHQIKTALSLSGNVLKTQRKLRTKLREALQLSQIQETHPGELLRVNREILACSRQLSQHSCLLEQKLNAFGSACCTNFSELLQMNRRLKEKLNEQSQVLLHGPQLSAYQEMFTYLEELENTLKGHMMKFIQWLKATVAGVSAIPLNHNGWCKRQKVCRNEAKVEDPFGEQARGAWACTIEEKVENLQQELEKQGKKVEKLEETNEMLRNRVAELELLQKPPNIVQGQDDGDPQITRHVFHDCFYKIINGSM